MEDETPKEPLPPVPIFSLIRVHNLRRGLADVALLEFYGCVISGSNFQSLVSALCKAMKLKAHSQRAMEDSVRFILGREFTEDMGKELAWRLAGNIDELKSGRSVPPWTAQRGKEWVPVQVTGGRKNWQKGNRGKHRFGWSYFFTVLAGSPTGKDLRQWWSPEKASVVGSTPGYTRKPPYHREEMDEIVGMRFCVLLEPELSDKGPGFFHIHCPPSFFEYNRDVIRRRRRIDFACPEKFSHACHQCFVGARECSAAVHRETYVSKFCPGCQREWWFDTDPRFVNDFCVHCQPRSEAGFQLGKIDTPGE